MNKLARAAQSQMIAFTTQVTTDNIVLWETQLDWVHAKTQTLLATSRTRQPQERILSTLEAQHLSATNVTHLARPHLAKTAFGQKNPNLARINVLSVLAKCVCVCVFKILGVFRIVCVQDCVFKIVGGCLQDFLVGVAPPPSLHQTAPRRTAQNFALFFLSPAASFILSPLSGGSSR